MTYPVARIGDLYDDGDTQMEGSDSVFANFIPIARVGDLTEGHICQPPLPAVFAPPAEIITGSGSVFVNYIPVAHVGDIHDVHKCGGPGGCCSHTGELINGSDNVMVGG